MSRRVLATVVRVSPRASFSYACCDQCGKKLSPARAANPAAANPAAANPAAANPALSPRRRVLCDVGNSGANSASGGPPTRPGPGAAPPAEPAPLFACRACDKLFHESSVKYRYSVTLVVKVQNHLKNITIFGSSLNPLFGMSCTHLQKTLKLKALEQFGTQTPTIDGRRVINALDQVAANLVVLLVVKNNIFAAMNELSDLMDKGLHLKKPRTTTTATSAYSSSRSKDFVASSIEFPTAPPLTVAHVLEILPIAQPVILDGAENVADAFQSFAIDLLDELIQQEESLPHDQGGSSSTSSTSGAEQEFRRIMSPPTTPRRNLAAPVLNLSFQDGDSDSEDETPEPTEETFEITPITPKTFFGIPSPPRSSITGESTYHERRGSSLLLEEDSLASDTFSLPSSPSKPNTNPDTNTLQDQFSCLTLVEDSPPRATQLRTMSTPKFGSKRKSGPSVPVIDSSSPFFVAETPLAVAPAAEQRNDFDQYKSLPSTPTIRKGSANCKFSDSLIAFPRNETLPLDSERQTPTFPIKRPTPHHDTVDDVHLIDSLSRLNVCCPSSLSETFPSPKKRTRHSKDDDDGDWRCESQTQYSSTGTSKISFKDGDIDDWLCSQSFSRGLNRGSTGSGNLGGASQGFSELNG